MTNAESGQNFRVLLVIHSLGIGGAESMVISLAKALRRLDCHVTLLILAEKDTDQTASLQGTGVHVVNLKKKPGFDPSIPRRIRKTLRETRPDAIHTHLPVLHYVALARAFSHRRIPWFHTLHSVATGETRSKALRLMNGLLFRSQAVRPVAISESVRKTIVDTYRVSPRGVTLVSNGIDMDRFRGHPSAEIHSPIKMVHVGRLEAVKNHDFMLDLVQHLLNTGYPPFVLEFVGDGPLRTHLAARIHNEGLSNVVTLAGSTDNVPAVLERSDLLLLPSKYEGQPMVILEAFASGVPVLATNLPTLQEIIVDGETGYLAELDIQAFSARLRSFAQNRDERREITARAFSEREKYTSMAMAEKYLELYHNAV